MHLINLFLQKRRVHENQHGLLMVATAYVLSALMLLFGSDIFYNINSSAADIRTDTYEETQELPIQEVKNTVMANLLLGQPREEAILPYGLTEATGTGLGNALKQAEAYPDVSLWLLGFATSSEEFDSLLETMALEQRDSTTDQVKASEETEEKTRKDSKETSSHPAEETGNSMVISISKKEVTMLERIVEAEATGEDMVGKILIANVIFNRIAAKEFPDSVEKVIFQNSNGEYQFSPVEDERYWLVKITKETKKAVQRALQGEDYSEGALYFISRKRTNSSSAKWFDQNLDWLFEHGGHEFYKNR